MKKVFNYISIFLILCFITLFNTACEIGLGTAVDLTPPVLKITKPEVAQNVPQLITIEGYATDNIDVARVVVTIQETNQSYRLLAGDGWQMSVNGKWQPYEAGTSVFEDGKVTFSLNVEVLNTQSGDDITIITQSYDSRNNEGKNSKDERFVTIDVSAPTVSISEPNIFKQYATASAQFNSFALKDNSVLSSLYNQDFVISGFQREDTQLNRLVVYVDSDSSETVPANEADYTSSIYKSEFLGDGVRNWSFDFKKENLPVSIQTGKHLLRIVTYSYDVAGNCEAKVQGWFVYWNEADKPWVTLSFGEDSINTTKLIYPNCALLAQAFDDDGLKSVAIKTVILDESQTPPVETIVQDLTTVKNLDADANPKYYSLSTLAIGELGKFYVEIHCTDIYGNVSEPVRGYLDVADVTPPNIVVNSSDKLPLNTDSFEISGRAIDDGGVEKLMILWQKNMQPAHEVLYLNGHSDQAWNLNTSGTENGYKIWVLNNNDLGVKENTKNGVERDFTFNFNFSDLGIIKTDFSGAKLTAQSFILCAIDNHGLSRTTTFTLNGDTDKPKLTIDKLIVQKQDGTQKEEKDLSAGTPELLPYNRDNSNNITDKIRLEGTWQDDSTFLNDLKLVWVDNQTAAKTPIDVTRNNDGTWYTDYITPPDKTTVVIEAELEDLGGNITTKSSSFYVNGAIAQFLRISTDKPDGYYKQGEVIDIYVEFTKAVKFKDGSANPEITLNNGKTAQLVAGTEETEKHTFRYTVGSADTTQDTSNVPVVLNVKSIDTKGNKWYDGDSPVWNSSGYETIDGSSISSNLNANRSIYIDTKKPELTSVTAISSSGYYPLGSKLYFSGTFSEEVLEDSLTGLKLKLSTGNNTTELKRTGPKTVMFTYVVQANDNTDNLSVSEIVYPSNGPTDKAGNIVDTTTSPTYPDISGLKLDTKTPSDFSITVSPTIPSLGGTTPVFYDSSSATVTIAFDNTEKTGVKKYTTNYNPSGANSWTDYTGPVTLGDGEYSIFAYQQDAAGNRKDVASATSFNVDNGYILQSINVNKPTGRYGAGETIKFTLTFRNEVTITNPVLNIKVGTASRQLAAPDISGKKTLAFEYLTESGVDGLITVDSLGGTFKDKYENDISSFVSLDDSTVQKFAEQITIDTSKPLITDVQLDGQKLQITFNTAVSRGIEGDVVLTMKEDENIKYLAPPFFTKDEWTNYKGDAVISTYYESNTVGCSEAGVADLTEKFVLKYEYDVNNTTLTAALKAMKANEASMSINSSKVQLKNNNTMLEFDFDGRIPVKGAEYTVSIPEGLVTNSMGNENDQDNTTYTVTLAGIESPVIRIKKTDEIIAEKVTKTPITAATGYTDIDVIQPVTAGAKIDCQTPGASITYQLAEYVANNGITMADADPNTVKLRYNNKDLTAAPDHTFTFGTSKNYSGEFSLTAGNNNEKKGYQVRIKATATKSDSSEVSYEQAMKTVIILTNRGKPTGYHFRCIRGGDWTSGGVSTPNFPFSWNTTEWNKIRTMTGNGNDDGSEYYWITWKLTTTAYVGFLAASDTMPEDANTNGPKNWWWASCGWVPDVANMPIYPGETTTCNANGVRSWKNGGFGFLDKHKQGR
jgi:hypothetical protein